MLGYGDDGKKLVFGIWILLLAHLYLAAMIGLFLLTMACLGAMLFLIYTETLWARLSSIFMVVGIALGWLPNVTYGIVLFTLACIFTSVVSFRMQAARFDKLLLSFSAALMALSLLSHLFQLPTTPLLLILMWPVALACSIQFIRQLTHPGDQNGLFLILAFEAWFQIVQFHV